MMVFGEIVFGQFRFFVFGSKEVRKRARLLGITLNTREKQISHSARDDRRAGDDNARYKRKADPSPAGTAGSG